MRTETMTRTIRRRAMVSTPTGRPEERMRQMSTAVHGRLEVQHERATQVRAGVRIEMVTVVWMTLEAAIAIGAGVVARSVLLTAFGVDSVIELVTGGVL